MTLRRMADLLLFHSSMRVVSQYEAARLERARENAQWRALDVPTWMRWGRSLTDELSIWGAQ